MTAITITFWSRESEGGVRFRHWARYQPPTCWGGKSLTATSGDLFEANFVEIIDSPLIPIPDMSGNLNRRDSKFCNVTWISKGRGHMIVHTCYSSDSWTRLGYQKVFYGGRQNKMNRNSSCDQRWRFMVRWSLRQQLPNNCNTYITYINYK